MLIFNVPAVLFQIWVTIKENALSQFHNTLIDWERVCIDYLTNNIPIYPLSRNKYEKFDNATDCHMFCKPFKKYKNPKNPKVRDNDRVRGWFIAAAHKQCNLQQLIKYQIPVFFDIFRGYYFNLIFTTFPTFTITN